MRTVRAIAIVLSLYPVALVFAAIAWARRARTRRQDTADVLCAHAEWVTERVSFAAVERHYTSHTIPTQRSAS